MRVKTTFELDHFIRYLNDFPNTNPNREEYDSEQDLWTVYLTDGANYIMTDQFWKIVQDSVKRFKGRGIVQ